MNERLAQSAQSWDRLTSKLIPPQTGVWAEVQGWFWFELLSSKDVRHAGSRLSFFPAMPPARSAELGKQSIIDYRGMRL